MITHRSGRLLWVTGLRTSPMSGKGGAGIVGPEPHDPVPAPHVTRWMKEMMSGMSDARNLPVGATGTSSTEDGGYPRLAGTV